MVVLQASLSVVVLASATVVGLSFRNLSAVPDGFDPTNRVVARVILPDAPYSTPAKRVAFADALLAALQREPELTATGLTTTLPVGDVRSGSRFFMPEQNGAISGEAALLHFRRISPGYPTAVGMKLMRGRLFTTRDDSASPRVAIISRALADQYWPDEDPIGKQIHRAGAGTAPAVPFEVVGVVGDAMDGGYEAPPGQTVYVPYAQLPFTRISIVAHS